MSPDWIGCQGFEESIGTSQQPDPIQNQSIHIADMVVMDIKARKALGIRRYGVALQAGNGRNALMDAYHEALDLCLYLRQTIEEGKG